MTVTDRVRIEDLPGYDPNVPVPPEVLVTLQPLLDAHNAGIEREAVSADE